MESMLKNQVQEELDLLSAFYPEEEVITEQLSHDKNSVTVTLKLEPNTGFDQARIAATIWSKFIFGPKVRSAISNAFLSTQVRRPNLSSLLPRALMETSLIRSGKRSQGSKLLWIAARYRMKELVASREECNDSNGIVYDAYVKMREIVTEHNDSLRGRCAICLEAFEREGGGG